MRVVNYRIYLNISIAIVLGIVTVVLALFANYIAVAILCCLFVALIVFSIKRLRMAVLILVMAFAVGGSVTYVQAKPNNSLSNNVVEASISGYVTDSSQFNDNYVLLVLRDVTIFESSTESKVQGKLSTTLFIYQEIPFDVGDKVYLHGTITAVDTVTRNDINSWQYRNNIAYTMEDCELLKYTESRATLAEQFRQSLYNQLNKFMPENADIVFALITGDKSYMSDVDKEAFRRAGVIHILAVSGLHIGFMTFMLAWVCDKLRLKFCITFPLITAIIVAYAYLCGFPPSVMRAVIMTVVALIAKRLHARNDMLNSISISATVILIFKPYYIFDAGFLLSFSAVFGICCAMPLTRRLLLLRLNNLPKFVKNIINAMIITLSATVATLPAIAYFYGELPVLGLITNLIVVPIVQVAFVWSIVVVFIPLVNYTLVVPNLLVAIICRLSTFISNLSFATVALTSLGIASVAYFVILFIVGGYVNVKSKVKAIVLFLLSCVCVVSYVVGSIPKDTKFSINIINSYNQPYVLITDNQGIMYAVGELNSVNVADEVVNYAKGYDIKQFIVVANTMDNLDKQGLDTLHQYIGVSKIYLFGSVGNGNIESKYQVVTLPKWESIQSNISISILDNGNSNIFYCQVEQSTLALVTTQCDYSYSKIISVLPRNTKWIISPQQNATLLAQNLPNSNIICPLQMQIDNIIGINHYGNFTINANSDKID